MLETRAPAQGEFPSHKQEANPQGPGTLTFRVASDESAANENVGTFFFERRTFKPVHSEFAAVHELCTFGLPLPVWTYLMWRTAVLFWLWQLAWASLTVAQVIGLQDYTGDDQQNVLVQLRRDDESRASAIAALHGFKNMGQIGSLKGYYWFKRRGRKISKREIRSSLRLHPDVLWTEIERPKKRVKRTGLPSNDSFKSSLKFQWKDPLYIQQWYLNGLVRNDMKVREAWKLGYTGKNVVVSILDDGIQRDHPDLAANYDPKASYDVNDNDEDPYPRDNNDNKHGTRCAGEVAAVAGNDWCGVGIAYRAKIGGVRMLDGSVSDRVEAESLSLNQNYIDIYSASWGPEDDGKTFDGPGRATKAAFYQGITEGRNGRGNIFIWASGNGGSHQDSCSCDGYTTSIYTLSVSSATFQHGKPWYLEECTSTLATTYSSGIYGEPAIATTDMPNRCTIHHTGTSASAPIAAGIVALALEANPYLTWRDMQHIVVRTSDPSALLKNSGWITNGAGRKVSSKFGYGIMNAEKLILLGKKWKTVPPQHTCTFTYEMDYPIPLSGVFSQNFSLKVGGCAQGARVRYLEHVQIILTVHFSRRGDLRIFILSPMGTRSEILPVRPHDENNSGFQKWPFMSVQQWGENPEGTWVLTLENTRSPLHHGAFHDWQLTLYGTEVPPQPGGEEYSLEVSNASLFGHPFAVPNFGGHQAVEKILYQNCHPECEGGCHAINSSLDCVQCKHFYQELRSRGGSKCVGQCEIGYYLDLKEKRCNLCLSGCATCSSAAFCDTCVSSLYLIISDPEDLSHGKCETDCPEGFYADLHDTKHPKCRMKCDSGCLNCTELGPCRFCKNGYFLTAQGRCVTVCPNKYFASAVTRKCMKCPENCLQCTSEKACDSCKPNYVWDNAQGRCTLHEVLTKCQKNSDCPPRMFCEKGAHVCQACHPDCSQCVGPSFDQCILCNDGQPPDQKANKCACPSGYYFNSERVLCQPCHPACAACHGPSSHFCSKCNVGYSLLGSSCIPCCKPSDSSHIFCAVCSDGTSPEQSSFHVMIILLSVMAVVLFVVVFAVLSWVDRKRRGGFDSYGYSKILVQYSLENDQPLLSTDGHVASDAELGHSDEEIDSALSRGTAKQG
uniref:P/Homo B domain-containing protein n=1 Tax=Trichuris muris TaxID=70415 RepID=A0A5S6QQA5_TRIMR